MERNSLSEDQELRNTLVKGEAFSCPSNGEMNMRMDPQQKADQPDDKATLLKRLDGAFRRLGQLIDRASQLPD